MTPPDFTRFTVTVDHLNDGHRVKVDTYATVEAPDLETALAMALPYMVSVAQPNPFAGLLARLAGEGEE